MYVHSSQHPRTGRSGRAGRADGSATFDSDILLGVTGRWYFRPDIALVTGYEFGKITLWNLGVRFTFLFFQAFTVSYPRPHR